MQFHIEQETERNVRSGMARAEARQEALRAFGGVDRFAEQARDERTGSALEDFVVDVRYALRWLRGAPGFAAVAVLTLALGIGSNTAIFSVVNAALLRPLPFPEPERIVQVNLLMADEPDGDGVWSYPKFEVLRDEQRVFARVAGYARWSGNLAGLGEPERLEGERVTAQYFDLLGVRARAGRVFTEQEASDPGHAQVAMLGEGLWRRRFNSDRGLMGRTVQLDGMPTTIVGIVPAEFRGLSGLAEVFLPVSISGDLLPRPWANFLTVIARLDASVTFERAASDMQVLSSRIEQAHPSPRGGSWNARLESLDALRIDPAIRRSVLVLFGAVVGVLLIACVNVANLLLARAGNRSREIAVRLAIGAQRGRLIRQLMTESLVLAAVGGAVGVLAGWAGVRGLAAVASNVASVLGRTATGFNAVSLSRIQLDAGVLLFALGASVLTGLLFGIVPALQASRSDLTVDLKKGASAAAARSGRGLASRNVLVVAEIALAFVLLTASGLMLRSLSRLLDIDAGINARNVLTVRISLPESNPEEASTIFWQELLTRTASLPAVRSAAAADCPPLIGRCYVRPFWPEGQSGSPPVPIGVHYITPGYFQALGVTLERGRAFNERDRAGSPNVVIINETAAQKYFPGQNPVGRRIAVGGGFASVDAEIVGVTSDQRFQSIEVPAEPDVYIAFAQVPQSSGYLFLRTAGSPEALSAAVRREVQRLDPNLPIYDVQTMEQRVGAATARTRVTGLLLALFATTALLLALLGVYGVVAYAVSQRVREISLRIALGALRSDIARLVLPHSVTLVSLGLGLGVLGAWSSTRVLRSLLYEVQPTDPLVFISLALATLLVAFAASALPILRATRVDPLTALKSE
jgi:predicted permease